MCANMDATLTVLEQLSSKDVDNIEHVASSVLNIRDALRLSKNLDVSIDKFIKYAPALVLLSTSNTTFQTDTWLCLANLSAGNDEHVRKLLNANIVPAILKTLKTCKDQKTLNNVMWACCNILGSQMGHDALVTPDFFSIFSDKLIEGDEAVTDVQHIVWAILNLCMHNDGRCEHYRPIVRLMCRILYKNHTNDEKIDNDICMAISYLSAINLDIIMSELDVDFLLVKIASCSNMIAGKYLLKFLRNISNNGTLAQIQILYEGGDGLKKFLYSYLNRTHLIVDSIGIQETFCDIIYNLTLRSRKQVNQLIEWNIIKRLNELDMEAKETLEKEKNAVSAASKFRSEVERIQKNIAIHSV